MSNEITSLEKALWESVKENGLLHPRVGSLYSLVCRGYEAFIVDSEEGVEIGDVEYELWKVHYRHIFEFRKMMGKEVMERFNLFVSEAMEFYQGLIIKVMKKRKKTMACKNSSPVLYLCHRLLVRLGDLARYKETNSNWSVSASYYLKAVKFWPDGGNPHNQLALLATYMGNDFLCSYRCVRSLAVKEPFPDARNNLILSFQTVTLSSLLDSISETARFNFFSPSERCSSGNETAPSGSSVWSLFVRIISFFFIESRIEEFEWTFGSIMKELDKLLELDDSSLKESLESYQFGGESDQERKGPYRSLQMVCILIFVVADGLKNESDFVGFSFIVIFVLMGRFMERCVRGGNKLEDCPLLPAALVMVEWLVLVMKLVQKYLSDERVNCSISYFFDSLIELLRLINGDGDGGSNDRNPLWEDYELRGFTPISKSHDGLDFEDDRKTLISPYSGYRSRAGRILVSAKRIADESKWIWYDETGRKFSRTEMVAVEEEEEVILFKPITRFNSVPPFSMVESCSDEELLRSMSLSEQIPVADLKENSTSTVGQPSLSSWVIKDGCFQIEKDKPGLSFVEEIPGGYPLRHPPSPTPSAPFIPDHAGWFDVGSSKNSGMVRDTSGILGPSPLINQTANWPIADSSPTFNPSPGYSPAIGLSSSEWLRQYRSRQNLEHGSNLFWPVHHLYTNGLGEYYAIDGSKLGFFDGWGNPVNPSQMVLLGNPQNPSGSLIYGVEEQRREKPGFPGGCGIQTAEVTAEEQQQQSLLRFLKEKEWQLHRQGQGQGQL